MLTAEDITNAARVRLAALDEEAKPLEKALAKINAERAKLRGQIAAGEGKMEPTMTFRYPGITLIQSDIAYIPSGTPWTSTSGVNSDGAGAAS